ncbi:hypothetical protein LTR94_033679, partial [Friedmanniomyces endolithicus]
AGDQDAEPCAGGDGAAVAAGREGLAPQRTALRRTDRAGQGADRGEAWRRTGAHLAPQLRRAAAPDRGGQRVRPVGRPPLRRDRGPRHGKPEGHDRARAALLGRTHRPRAEGRAARADLGARQFAARA